MQHKHNRAVSKFIFLGLLICTWISHAQTNSSFQISGDLVTSGDVSDNYQISPDEQTVVYLADQDTDGVDELYSVSINGGTVTKLNSVLVAGGNVSSFGISPDSQTVVYTADQDIDRVNELYRVDIAGGSVNKLNVPLTDNIGIGVVSFRISNDSQTVVYTADPFTGFVVELFSVSLSADVTSTSKLNGTLVAGGSVDFFSFEISADSQRVVYIADQDIANVTELYSVAINGTDLQKLNATLPTGGNVDRLFTISDDSQRVVYRAGQDTDQVFELYSVVISGGSVVKLNSPLVAGGTVVGFSISPDSQTVVYTADQDTDGVQELYRVPITDGAVVKINNAISATNDILSDFEISGDSQRVVYRVSDRTTPSELYSALLSGGAPIKLNNPLPIFANVTTFKISANSQTVVYIADQNIDGAAELFRVGIAGGNNTQLNPVVVSGGDVINDFRISADNQRVVYRADQDTNDTFELYSVLMDGSEAIKLNAELPFNADVEDFAVSANGAYVVYRADQNEFDLIELFAHELPENEDDVLCFPIVASNGGVAVICL